MSAAAPVPTAAPPALLTRARTAFQLKSRWLSWLDALAAVTVMAAVMGWLGSWWWLFDLFSSFRAQYAVGLLVAAFVFGAARRRYRLAVYGIFALANLLPVVGDFDHCGATDVAVVDTTTWSWYAYSLVRGQFSIDGDQWGYAGVGPVPADYDGDGFADPAVLDPRNWTWYLRYSSWLAHP